MSENKIVGYYINKMLDDNSNIHSIGIVYLIEGEYHTVRVSVFMNTYEQNLEFFTTLGKEFTIDELDKLLK